MKKVLIAALATAFAAPAASYAATSNVDIYGRIAATYNVMNTDTSVAGQDKTLYQVSSDNSYIGFKGAEDLGGGLAAVYQLEVGFDAEGGNNNLNTGTLSGTNTFIYRNTFVGLKSNDFGTVLLGKHDTPYKMATSKLDVFGNEPADYRNIIGNIDGTSVFAQRPGNVIAYVTPNFSGFSAIGAYVAGNETGNGTSPNSNAWSVAAMYDNGPIYATLAYEKHNDLNNQTIARYMSAAPTTPVYVANGATLNNNAWKAGVGYDFGPGKVGLIYEHATVDNNTTGTSYTRSAYLLDGAYNVTGNIVLKASWGHAGSLSNTSDTGANSYAVGADYVFSKRTKLIAQYQKVDNGANASYGVGFGTNAYYAPGLAVATAGGSTTGIAGNNPSIISVGMVHTF